MTTSQAIAFAVGSYLFGSISWSILLGRLIKGVDIRRTGSGNAGATNTLRLLGVKAAVAVFILDLLKGLLPVLLAKLVSDDARLQVVAGLAAIAGHDFPVYHGFRGGRGVATSFGATMGMMPLLGPLMPFIGGVILIPTRLVSLMSTLGTVMTMLIVLALCFTDRVPDSYGVFAVFAAALIVWQHRENITRLRSGTEPKLGERSRHAPAARP
jgi:acyl phosphate:glycerol-3-phosphate acyltransferase